MLGEKPLVLDGEFSYEGLFQAAEKEGVKYVVRLNLGTRPTLTDAEGNQLALTLKRGKWVLYRGVYYKGKVKGNGAGEWREGFQGPLWVFSTLEPEQALERMLALMLLAYGIGLLVGEALRRVLYREKSTSCTQDCSSC